MFALQLQPPSNEQSRVEREMSRDMCIWKESCPIILRDPFYYLPDNIQETAYYLMCIHKGKI